MDGESPDAIEWWRLEHYPGSKRAHGVERRIASYLYRNVAVGDTVTTDELRRKITIDGKRNEDEHFQRRLRELRKDGWILPTQKELASLGPEEYLVQSKGWAPELGARGKKKAISNSVRNAVFARDGFTCQLCGERAGDVYADDPMNTVRLTVGHIVAQAHGGGNAMDNLRAECSRCNETKRDEGQAPEHVEHIWSSAVNLPLKDKKVLLSWLLAGARPRDKVEQIYVRTRLLSSEDRARTVDKLRAATEK